MNGILLVDKPRGRTSHDLVADARRALGQRDVGHAGTLDPMATGLLVLLVGEATKLSAYVTADTKRYLATVHFGMTTDTLDADGEVIARSDAPPPDAATIARALADLVGPMDQVPPAVSAIKQRGVAAHRRVRRGEFVNLAPRPVVLEAASVCAMHDGACEIDVTCSKGFYVRALARDLAARVGTVGCLTALRRVRSGAYAIDEAIDGALLQRAARARSPDDVQAVRGAVLGLEHASRTLRTVHVNDAATSSLGHGRPVAFDEPDGVVLVMDASRSRPVCIGAIRDGVLGVLRGFRSPAS
jgi:tRNA pseudouridine55 synthase